MKDRSARLLAIGISTLLSILLVSGISLLVGSDDPALKATGIAMLSASIALEVYPRLLARSRVRESGNGAD